MLTSVATSGHTEAKIEVKALQALVPEEVPLDHSEVFHLVITNCKLYTIFIMRRNLKEKGNLKREREGGREVKDGREKNTCNCQCGMV